MATTNFLPFNPGLANAENDATYLSDTMRTGGATVGALLPSALFNKLMAQCSLFVAAFCQAFAATGTSTSDADFAGLVAALTNVIVAGGEVPAITAQNSYASPDRVLGTVYQNTGVTPRYVTVSLGASGAWAGIARCDASPSPVTQVASMGGVTVSANCHFIVLPNYYYALISSGGSPIVDDWTEWQ